MKEFLKVYKQFQDHLEHIQRLEAESSQVVSSLGNVAQRLPNFQQSPKTLGVLTFNAQTIEKLEKKHFLAIEKSYTFLLEIITEYQDRMKRLQVLLDQGNDILSDISPDETLIVHLQWMEWMENVTRMYEWEILRKQYLIQKIVYHNVAQLQQIVLQWPVTSTFSNVNMEYIKLGLAKVPTIPSEITSGSKKLSVKKNIKNK